MNGSGSDTIPHFLRACMHILRTSQHPDINDLTGAILHRKAARGINKKGLSVERETWLLEKVADIRSL